MDAERMWRQIGAMWEWSVLPVTMPGVVGGKVRKQAACPWCGAPFAREASTGGAYAGEWTLEPETRVVQGRSTRGVVGLPTSSTVATGRWILTCPRCGWEGRFRAQEGTP